MGAKPECEPVLHIAIENLRTARRLSDESSVSALDDHLVWALQKLGEIYVQGPELYVDSRAQLKPIASIEEMRDYRHQLMASGTWGGETLSFVSEDWWAKAEAPIFEAISLWGSLEAHYSEKEFKSRLGDLFRYLGFSYMKTGRDDEAVDALQEAEEMYLDIYDFDPARFQPLVMDTRISLVELSGRTVMLEGDGGKQNRITALENSLPFLREDAYITEFDRANGITMAKSSARDRLTNALRELASEYKTIGMHDKAESLWNGELGELITESLPIRYG